MAYKPQKLEVAAGGTGDATLTNHGVLIGQGTSGIAATAAGTAGQVLQSGGASADPTYSTATFPSTATSTGTILRANGTNWAATTATYPTTTTANQILYSSSSNVIGEISAAANSLLITNGSNVPALGTTLANSFACTASSSGGTISTTTSNTSNTASSNALQQVTVAGTSAGDAQSTYTVTGGSQWSLGTDNSDSDAFTISGGAVLGTNNVMHVTGNGEINYPLQPAFLATHSADQNDATGNGAAPTVTFATEIFDQNGDFATNTFTAPVTGRYQLSGSVAVFNLTAAMTGGGLVIVTSNRNYSSNGFSWGGIRTAGNTTIATASNLADMDAADTATIVIQVTGGAGDTADLLNATANTFFSGYLAC